MLSSRASNSLILKVWTVPVPQSINHRLTQEMEPNKTYLLRISSLSLTARQEDPVSKECLVSLKIRVQLWDKQVVATLVGTWVHTEWDLHLTVTIALQSQEHSEKLTLISCPMKGLPQTQSPFLLLDYHSLRLVTVNPKTQLSIQNNYSSHNRRPMVVAHQSTRERRLILQLKCCSS